MTNLELKWRCSNNDDRREIQRDKLQNELGGI